MPCSREIRPWVVPGTLAAIASSARATSLIACLSASTEVSHSGAGVSSPTAFVALGGSGRGDDAGSHWTSACGVPYTDESVSVLLWVANVPGRTSAVAELRISTCHVADSIGVQLRAGQPFLSLSPE